MLAVLTGFLMGLSMILVSPVLVLAGLIAIFLLFLLLKLPELGILSLIALTSTFFSSDANLGFSIGFGHIYLTDILLITLLMWTCIRSLVDPRFKLISTPVNIPLLAFVFLAFLSTFIAILQSALTLQQSLGEIRNIANYLLFFGVINLIRNEKQIRILTNGLLILATLVPMVMIVQYILGSSVHLLPGRVEVLSTEGTSYSDVTRIIPPGYSLVFVAFIFLSVMLPYGEYKSHRAWLVLPWLLTGIGVLLTFKRHFWVAAILIFLLIIYLSKKAELKRIIGWGVFALVISAIGFFFVVSMAGSKGSDLLGSSTARLASLLDVGTYQDPNSSLRWRDFEYKYALPQIVAHPLLGMGLGARYRPFIPHRDNAVYDGRGFIHNGHVWIMLKTGLLGYAAMFWLIITFVVRGLRSWRKLLTPYARTAVLGFTLAYIGMLIGTIVEPMLIEWRWTALLAVIMGLNEAVIQVRRVPEPSVYLTLL